VRLRPRHVRARLTLWYVGFTGLVLIAFICGASVLQLWQLTRQIYHAEIQDVQTVEGLLYFSSDGQLKVHDEYHKHPESRLLLDRLMEILTPDGQVLFRNERLQGREMGGRPFPREGNSGYNERSLRLQDGTRVLLISHLYSIQGRPLLIRLAYSSELLTRALSEFVALLLLTLPFALIAAGFVGYRVAGKMLSPLKEMVESTNRITAHRLYDRIPVENAEDELGKMASVLNGLLQRLEESFSQLKRFTSDVSHELRTPLASMRSVGEVGLQKEQTPAAYRDIIGSMLEEVSRLTQMIESLLIISRADAGEIRLHLTTFRVMDLVQEVIALVGVLAEEKKQRLVVSGDETIRIAADRLILRQAIMNLLENAVKYSPVGGAIYVEVSSPLGRDGARLAELKIRDEGPGIPEESRAKVFERFYRVDDARSREAGGAGLGLAIAKWAVTANRGEIGLAPGISDGCQFCITLPSVEAPPEEEPFLAE
jgi:heavy metal sensor kinase